MVTNFNLSVYPNDTAERMVAWFQFNTYLQRKLDCAIHFEPQDSFPVERQNVLGEASRSSMPTPSAP